MITLNMSAEQVGSTWSNATPEQRREHRTEIDAWFRHQERPLSATPPVRAGVDGGSRPPGLVHLGAGRGPMAKHRGPEADARAAAGKITCTSCGATPAVTASPSGVFNIGFPQHSPSCTRRSPLAP